MKTDGPPESIRMKVNHRDQECREANNDFLLSLRRNEIAPAPIGVATTWMQIA